jgi:hypothetical protein
LMMVVYGKELSLSVWNSPEKETEDIKGR